MINRVSYIQQIQSAFRITPVVAILGPRQCGKTTLAQLYASEADQPITRFDLEDPLDLAKTVVVPLAADFPLAENIRVMGLEQAISKIREIKTTK